MNSMQKVHYTPGGYNYINKGYIHTNPNIYRIKFSD